MDPSPVQTSASVEEDEWDNDGFIIPSLGIEEPDHNNTNPPNNEITKPSEAQTRKEANIYLGPHGAPPTQAKQKEQNTSRKQRFKQKLKEADGRYAGTGRENKMDSLRELVGGQKVGGTATRNSPREWLDPHCHESEFERRNLN